MNIPMDSCFLCTKDYNCVTVDDLIVSQMEYLLPEITIFKMGIPLRICSVCNDALYAFNKFKQFCMESSRRLEDRIKGAQTSGALGPPQNQVPLDRVSANINLHTDTNIDNTEENDIKKEILEETQDHESCESILRNKLLEHCSSRELNTEGGSAVMDTCATSVIKSEMIEEIFIKDEPLEETPENMNIYLFESTLKEEKEDNITEHDIEPKCATLKSSETCNIKPNNMEICNNVFQNTLDENSLTKQYTETERATLHTTEPYDTIPEKIEQIFITEPLYHNPQVFQNTLGENKKNQQSENVTETINNKISVGPSAKLKKSKKQVKTKTNSEKIFQCEVCKKIYKNTSSLNQHIKTHSEVKEYECDICNKGFTKRSTWDYHMKTHTGVKDFACPVCKKTFITKNNVKLHLKVHSKVKNFACTICSKEFICQSRLNRHMLYHTETRKFQCELCSKAFNQKVHYEHHMKVHAGIKDFPCSVCKKAFTCRSAVNQHMKIHSKRFGR